MDEKINFILKKINQRKLMEAKRILILLDEEITNLKKEKLEIKNNKPI